MIIFKYGQYSSDGSGSKNFDPGRVGSGQFFVARVRSGRVSHLWFGLKFGKFPLKMSNFSIFSPSGQKKLLRVGSESTRVRAGSASYYCGSKVSSGRVRAHHYNILLHIQFFYEKSLLIVAR